MDEISYKLTFEERDAYLHVCIEADSVSFEMIIDYTNKIVSRIKDGGYDRIMLLNDSPVLPSTDCYVIASYILKNAFSRPIRLAVVDTAPGNSRKQQQISQHSRDAGLDIQSFSDGEKAEQWLLSKNGKSHGAS